MKNPLLAAILAAALSGCAGGDVRRMHEFDLAQLRKDALVQRHETLLAAENAESPPLLTVRGPALAFRSGMNVRPRHVVESGIQLVGLQCKSPDSPFRVESSLH